MKPKAILLKSMSIMIFFICAGCGCRNEMEKENIKEVPANIKKSSKNENLNISILLDLSDRVDPEKNANPSMEFYRRDLGYIESISKGFEQHLRSKLIRHMNDQIQVYFEPEPLDANVNSLSRKLKLSFTKDNARKEAILKISSLYNSASSEIYKFAIRDKKYVGSDIWGFFKNNVDAYCIKPNHRNILFILTDGYMYHQNSLFKDHNRSSYITPKLIRALDLNTTNYKDLIEKKGYGFIKANDDLHNLEVVVLGINPARGNPFEMDVINKYWSDWFKLMKIKIYLIKSADLPSNLDPIIQKYINP